MDILEQFLKSRPTSEINAIISAMDEHSSDIACFKNQVITIDTGSDCLLLCEGRITILDEKRNQISSVYAPLVLGFKGCFNYGEKLVFRCGDNIRIKTASVKDLDCVLSEKRLWREAAHILAFYNAFLSLLLIFFKNPSSSPLVRIAASLLALNELQRTNKSRERVAIFIMKNTHLSRSVVMKNIKHLKDNGVISTHNGVLDTVNGTKLSHILKTGRLAP